MPPEFRYRALVEYDGTDFLGYQIQARGRTVQGEIEKSLNKITRTEVRVDGAGRTDAGVHAVGQVIAFNVAWRHTLEDLHRAFNATLPADIVISDLEVVQDTFHPRFQALSRTYHYFIISQRWPSVMKRRYAHHVSRPLNVEAMAKASRDLLGQQDFAAFGKPPQGNNSIRSVTCADWYVSDDKQLTFKITANAFLYRMVRTIVGTLIQIGMGQGSVGSISEILESCDLTRSAAPAPACGLCLMNVVYPEDLQTR